MPALPGSLALTSIADGSNIVAADHRNNYAAIQAAMNALITDLSGGTAGALLQATSSSAIGYLPDAPTDGDPLVWDTTNGRWVPASTLTSTKRKLPGQELAYAEFTAPVSVNAVVEASATQVVSAGAFTFDGATPVIIEFFCPALAAGGGVNCGLNLWDGASDIGRLFDGTTVLTAASNYPCYFRRKITPSAAAHTYSVRIWCTTASNFIAEAGAGGAGVKLPGYIRITRA